jgi:hypothetical protein
LTVVDLLLLHDGLHLGEVACVSRHVGRKNYSDESLAEGFEIVARKVF